MANLFTLFEYLISDKLIDMIGQVLDTVETAVQFRPKTEEWTE